MRKRRDLLAPLLSLGVGALAGLMMMAGHNYADREPVPSTHYVRPTLTPDQLIPSVSPTPEGDDGSLGGPVYDKDHQLGNPKYVYNIGR